MRRWKIDEDTPRNILARRGDWGSSLVSPSPALDVPSPSLPSSSLFLPTPPPTRPTTMSDDEQHNHNFEQVLIFLPYRHLSPRSPPVPVLIQLVPLLRPMLGLPPPSPCSARPFARTATSSSRACLSPLLLRLSGTNRASRLSGRPCKIVDMSTSKTGKHGHAKVHLVGIDVRPMFLPVKPATLTLTADLHRKKTGTCSPRKRS